MLMLTLPKIISAFVKTLSEPSMVSASTVMRMEWRPSRPSTQVDVSPCSNKKETSLSGSQYAPREVESIPGRPRLVS